MGEKPLECSTNFKKIFKRHIEAFNNVNRSGQYIIMTGQWVMYNWLSKTQVVNHFWGMWGGLGVGTRMKIKTYLEAIYWKLWRSDWCLVARAWLPLGEETKLGPCAPWQLTGQKPGLQPRQVWRCSFVSGVLRIALTLANGQYILVLGWVKSSTSIITWVKLAVKFFQNGFKCIKFIMIHLGISFAL